jgi:hypothetical protein
LPTDCNFLVLRDRAGRKYDQERGQEWGTHHVSLVLRVNSEGARHVPSIP